MTPEQKAAALVCHIKQVIVARVYAGYLEKCQTEVTNGDAA